MAYRGSVKEKVDRADGGGYVGVMSTHQNQAERILAKFPSIAQLARELGLYRQAVHRWKYQGWIPANKQSAVIDAGRKLGVDIHPADFFEDRSA